MCGRRGAPRRGPGGANEAAYGEAEWEKLAEEVGGNADLMYMQIEPVADPAGPLRGPGLGGGPLRGPTCGEGPVGAGQGVKRRGHQEWVTKEPEYGEIRRQIKWRKAAKTMKECFGKVPFRDTR